MDEFETIRLLDYEGLNQEASAKRMGVARTTVTAMYESARKKLAQSIVEGKRFCIGGGAQMALVEAGIKLYAGASGNTDDVVEAFLNGTLNAVGEANCDHHDHEHGEGHTCGHGGCHH